MSSDYEKNSITLPGAIAMGTGVMIGATTSIETGLTFQSLEAAR